MQGTGTQTDPFYPTNWNEFLTAIQQENAYVECPENGIWDMNEMLPDGLKNTINWRACLTNANGLTIKNLYFNGGFFNFGNPTYDINIYRINFLNMTTSGSSSNIFNFYVLSGYHGSNIYIRNCKLSGLISSGVVFNAMYPIYLTHDGEKSCSLNFKLIGNGTLCYSYPPYFQYCNIKLDGETTGNSGSQNTSFERCYISGKSPYNIVLFYGHDNVLDIEIPEGKYMRPPDDVEFSRSSVLNIDKFYGQYNNSNSKYIEVTEEQLSDAAYLQSKGFSIVG